MKKLANIFLKLIQSITIVIAVVSIVLSVCADNDSLVLRMALMFCVSVAIAGCIELFTNRTCEEVKPTVSHDEELPEVEEKQITQSRSAKAVFCNYDPQYGIYLYNRRK